MRFSPAITPERLGRVIPQIPQYVARNTPEGSLGIRSVDTGAEQIARGASALASGVREVGASQFAIQDASQQKAQRDALVAADTAFATFQAKQETRLKQRQLEAPLDVKDFTATTFKEYDDGLTELRKGITDPLAQQLVQGRAQVYRERLAGDSTLFEAEQGIKNRVASVVTAGEQRTALIRAKPELFDETLQQHLAVLESAGLPPDVLRNQQAAAREQFALSAVATDVERNPAATLKALSAEPGKSGNSAIEALSSDGRERLRNAAEIEIRQREAEARSRAVEARMLATAQSGALKDYMADAQKQFAMGFGLPKDYADVRQAIRALPDDDPRKGAMLRDDAVLSTLDSSGFMALPPAKQQEAITELEVQLQSGSNPAAIDMLQMARSVQAETARMAKEDPFGFSLRRGVVKLPASTGDPAADMKARATAGRQASAFLGMDVPGFTGAELTTLGENYTKGSLDTRLGILASLVDSHGQEQASTVFEALDKKNFPGMGLAGALVMDDPEAARLVVKGQKALIDGGKAGDVLVPKATDVGPELTAILGDAYGLGSASRNTVEQGVLAAYAALSADAGDTSGELDSGRLEQAVQAVTGGLVTYGGRTMPVPKRGVTQEQFSGWAESLQSDDFKGVAGLDPARALDVFKRDGWLEAIGPNRYAPVILGPDGRGRYLTDGQGNPLALSYDGGKVRSTAERASEAYGLTPFGPPR